MSTRCNVIIKNYDESGEPIQYQLYHHHDGYPEGVGADLMEYIKEIQANEDKGVQILSSCEKLAEYLCDPLRHDEYENEGTNIRLHFDIEYLYIIDLSTQVLECFEIDFHSISNISFMLANDEYPNDLKRVMSVDFELI